MITIDGLASVEAVVGIDGVITLMGEGNRLGNIGTNVYGVAWQRGSVLSSFEV